jgi:hypothetical protein
MRERTAISWRPGPPLVGLSLRPRAGAARDSTHAALDVSATVVVVAVDAVHVEGSPPPGTGEEDVPGGDWFDGRAATWTSIDDAGAQLRSVRADPVAFCKSPRAPRHPRHRRAAS